MGAGLGPVSGTGAGRGGGGKDPRGNPEAAVERGGGGVPTASTSKFRSLLEVPLGLADRESPRNCERDVGFGRWRPPLWRRWISRAFVLKRSS
jgi:hypothetical protein